MSRMSYTINREKEYTHRENKERQYFRMKSRKERQIDIQHTQRSKQNINFKRFKIKTKPMEQIKQKEMLSCDLLPEKEKK